MRVDPDVVLERMWWVEKARSLIVLCFLAKSFFFEKLERIFMFHSIFQRQSIYRKNYFKKLTNSMFFRNVSGGRNELGGKVQRVNLFLFRTQ